MAAGKREKILIVDDAEVNRGILCEVFKDSYDVIEAENGQTMRYAMRCAIFSVKCAEHRD